MEEVILNININDEQLQELINWEFQNLPKEKLDEIVLGIVKNQLEKDINKWLFVQDGWNSQKPGPILEKMLNQIDFKEFSQPVYEQTVKIIQDNYMEIFYNALVVGITKCLFGPDAQLNFEAILHDSVIGILKNYVRKDEIRG